MTIYELLRRLVLSAPLTTWGGPDEKARERQAAAVRLIDRLEEQGLLGQVAIDVKEEL